MSDINKEIEQSRKDLIKQISDLQSLAKSELDKLIKLQEDANIDTKSLRELAKSIKNIK